MSDRPRWWNCFIKLGYVSATEQVALLFQDGSIYVYDDMSRADYDRLRGTYVGIGKWFNEDVRRSLTTDYHRVSSWPAGTDTVVEFDEQRHVYRQIG